MSNPFDRVKLVDAKRLKEINDKLSDAVITEPQLRILLEEVDAEIAKTKAASCAISLIETLHFTKGRICGLLQALGVTL